MLHLTGSEVQFDLLKIDEIVTKAFHSATDRWVVSQDDAPDK